MTAAMPKKTPYEMLLEVPEGQIAEVIDGELYMQAQPMDPHINAAGMLHANLVFPYQVGRGGPGGWWIRIEAQFHTGDPDWRALVPDVSGWRKERVPTPPQTYFDTAPDWVCEVLSPSTRLYDRQAKAQIYLEEGVSHMWLVDPYKRLFEAYEAVDGAWRLTQSLEESGPICAAPFVETSFDLADLWS